jgi:wyosine [tRNA(Phe)-imidazoG37] synthetase (radical SAM superfamily)
VITRSTLPITFAKKNLQGKFCLSPFNSLHVNTHGEVNICLCPAWQPTSIGSLYKSSLDELLSSSTAQKIRQSIIDGSYTYCNENQCPLILNNTLNTWDQVPDNIKNLMQDSTLYDMPYEIAFNGDLTCNLSCPSCRTHVIKVDPDQFEQQLELAEKMYNHLFSKPSEVSINFITSGSGEIFASPMLLNLLSKISLKDFPNLRLNLHTNGLLTKNRWSKIQHLESNITQITVSIDAASADTYRVVRRGGEWQDLLENMDFIVKKKQQLGFQLHARLIVQVNNYKEILEFYNLCKHLQVDRIEYSRLLDWNTMAREEFKNNDVFDKNHPELDQARFLINQVRNFPGAWVEGNFS